jgi:small nuclear ribonucleoprotein D3
MSVRGLKNIGVPTVLLHEGEGLTLTVETRAGYSYRGVCATTEDNMNISLKEVTATDPRGAVSRLERVFIRGSQVLLVVFPEIFSKAPFFTRVALASQGVSFAGGLGRGRQAAIGARGASSRRAGRRGCGVGEGGGEADSGGGSLPAIACAAALAASSLRLTARARAPPRPALSCVVQPPRTSAAAGRRGRSSRRGRRRDTAPSQGARRRPGLAAAGRRALGRRLGRRRAALAAPRRRTLAGHRALAAMRRAAAPGEAATARGPRGRDEPPAQGRPR